MRYGRSDEAFWAMTPAQMSALEGYELQLLTGRQGYKPMSMSAWIQAVTT